VYRVTQFGLGFVLSALLACSLLTGHAEAQTLPAGFQDQTVFSGLTNPTAVAFSSDGRVFVAEKSGLVKVFNNLSDPTPDVFIDLRTNVYNFWDRGLLGLALHPNFPTQPWVYLLYTYDAAIGGTAPRWGAPGVTGDPCPTPPGPTTDGCVVSGRLSRVQASGNVAVGPEQVLIEDWCQQYPSHSIGQLVFGADGALYVSGGDGASFDFVDYGQDGSPVNPCGDPPGTQSPPNARGGALRSQSLRRPAGEPVVLGGTVLRVDPETGAALPTNPNFGHANANARRVVAYGFRNPFRLTTRPGTNEIWVGDVGWTQWEEINRIQNPTAGVLNFGWPCYEGDGRQSGYDSANLNLCESLYSLGAGAITPPLLTYNHSALVVPGETCPTGSSSISGLAFYNGGNYPAAYTGALFFADYSRECIWAMLNPPGAATLPQGLVAAYGFNEGSGASAADATGNGHAASVSATWTTQGKYGNALQFNGLNETVTVADSAALDLTTSMTLSAWVFPTTTTGIRDIIIKEGANVDIYNLYARNWRGLPESNVLVGGTNRTAEAASGLPANVWTHVTGTYDGTAVRLFINGVLAATTPVTGPISTSTGPLRIGGNQLWGEHFQGRIDEVRVYNRALAANEIQTDMNTPLSSIGTSVTTFVAGARGPVHLTIGPGGDLFYADFDGGTVRRIVFNGQNNPPVAAIQATPTQGAVPLAVQFSAAGSTDPNGDPLTFSWDLDGNGVFGDSTIVNPAFTYTTAGARNVQVRVSDGKGGQSTAGVTITAGTRPVATINSPSASLTWKVGDPISFSGSATDAEDGTLPATALTWTIILHHCPSNCHTHPVTTFVGAASGVFTAPDHEYPSHLELQLTARDSSGLTDTKSVLVMPQTTNLSFATSPTGLQIAVNATSEATPFSRTVILGSVNSISATTPQVLNGNNHQFASWSDGGAQTHNIVANGAATYTATYQVGGSNGLVAAWSFNAGSGTTVVDVSGNGRTGTISGATWSTQGKYGNALSFDGVNDWVTVADHNSLDLTTGMTLSAWVFPTTTAGLRDILIKEGSNVDIYNLYARNWRGLPESNVFVGGLNITAEGTALPANVWTHVAGTYDGSVLRLFVNGVQAASATISGTISVSTGPLRIGGNSMWGEFFQGRIDDVRVYNRALTQGEIQSDMNTPLP
jgi:glucose/arabinose dehydrogenase/PKD repeat protein